jgi:hypothetical protein
MATHPPSACSEADMRRTIFVVYLAFVVGALAFFILVGLLRV